MTTRSIIVIFSMLFAVFVGGENVAMASAVQGVSTEVIDGQTHIRLTYDGVVETPHIFTLPGDAPRVVVDLKQAGIGANVPDSAFGGQGALGGIRHAVRGEGTRIVLDLTPQGQLLRHSHTENTTHIILSGANANESFVAQTVLTASAVPTSVMPIRVSQKSALGVPLPRVKPRYSAKPVRRPIIVIDAGHGGYDPGAIGGAGTKEKLVTLKAAQELQAQLAETGRYDVVLTREKDVYVVHDERLRRARAIDADLFISIHADSLDSNKTRGASVYTLADHAHKRSTKLVDRQNWIMDVDLTQTPDHVDDILVDLAQRKTFSNSDQFAEMLVPNLSKVTPILGNTHRRAGLAVLLAPDVPAILLEMGFLSNAQDEKALNSAAHREKLMGAVAKTIDSYFSE